MHIQYRAYQDYCATCGTNLANIAPPCAAPPQVSQTSPSRDLGTFQRSESRLSSTLLRSRVVESNEGDQLSTSPSKPTLSKKIELNDLNRRVRTLEQLLFSTGAPDSDIGNPHGLGPPSISELKNVFSSQQHRRIALNKSRLYVKVIGQILLGMR
jgi:hypothetical protein